MVQFFFSIFPNRKKKKKKFVKNFHEKSCEYKISTPFQNLIQNSLLYKHYIQVGPVLITNVDPDPSIIKPELGQYYQVLQM